MKPIHNVKLAFRCGEDLAQMSPCDGGRFWGVCNKKVIDFTQSTQEAFNQTIAESGSVCGMFTAEQLMPKPSANYSLWRRVAASVFIALGFSSMSKELLAQSNPIDSVPMEASMISKFYEA
jgi:hypothetical protein